MAYLALIVLCLVFLVIALRSWLHSSLAIWHCVAVGAAIVLVTGQLSWQLALQSIHADLLGFLLGVFIIGHAMERSGDLQYFASLFLARVQNKTALLCLVVFFSGIVSAFFLNDTVAIVAVGLVVYIEGRLGIAHKPLLLVICFAMTIGSVMSPVGNPQNILIAVSGGLRQPFYDFFRYLALPTLLNLALLVLLFRWVYAKDFRGEMPRLPAAKITDQSLATCDRWSIGLFVGLMLVKVALEFVHIHELLPFSAVALIAALPIVCGHKKRWQIIRETDWATLLFFVSLFVLTASVWESGVLQEFMKQHSYNWAHVPVILAVSAGISQLISNVPAVSLYLPVLHQLHANSQAYLALSVGSTVAGNITIMGAASTVIVVQAAQKRGVECFGFFEYMRLGLVVTIINFTVYGWFL